MTTPDTLDLWTVYDHPTDFPDGFIARLWRVGENNRPCATDRVCIGATLDAVRAQLPPGLHRMSRMPDDDSVIVETWL